MAYDLNDKREHILAIVSDLVSSFLYYDRKVATGWPQTGDIQQAVKDGILTVMTSLLNSGEAWRSIYNGLQG